LKRAKEEDDEQLYIQTERLVNCDLKRGGGVHGINEKLALQLKIKKKVERL
jgi:hypothetical protein